MFSMATAWPSADAWSFVSPPIWMGAEMILRVGLLSLFMYILNFSASWSIMVAMGEAGVEVGFEATAGELRETEDEARMPCVSNADEECEIEEGIVGIWAEMVLRVTVLAPKWDALVA